MITDTSPIEQPDTRRPCPLGCGRLVGASKSAMKDHLWRRHAGLSLREQSDVMHEWKYGQGYSHGHNPEVI